MEGQAEAHNTPIEILLKIGQDVLDTGDMATRKALLLSNSLFRSSLFVPGQMKMCDGSKDIMRLHAQIKQFKQVFPDLTFRNLSLLAIAIPNSLTPRLRLLAIITATPTLTQLNIRMNLLTLFSSRAFKFLAECAEHLQGLRILRVAYFVSDSELDEFGVRSPWRRAGLWDGVIAQLPSLEVVQIVAAATLTDINDVIEREWVLQWVSRGRNLQRVYLYHGADFTSEIVDEVDGLYLGRRVAYLREDDGVWTQHRWRERSWGQTMEDAGQDVLRGGPQWWVTMREDDIDPLGGENMVAI